MKTFKKSIAILLSVLMLCSVMAVAGVSVSAADEQTEGTETTYYVVGDEALFGVSWATDDANAMTQAEDGNYYLVKENVAAGTYEYKVVDSNGTWYPDGTDNNCSVVAEEGATITFCYNTAEDTPTATAEVPATSSETESETATETETETDTSTEVTEDTTATETETETDTSAEETTEVTEETTDVSEETTESTEDTTEVSEETTEVTEDTTEVTEDTTAAQTYLYYVVGGLPDGATGTNIFGVSWAIDAANGMTLKEDGNYYLTIENVPAGTYEFKTQGADETWYPTGMGNNSSITVDTDGATVIFCFNVEEGYCIASADGTDPTYPATTASTTESEETTAPTTAASEGTAVVNVTSNVGTASSATYDLSLDSTVTIKFSLTAAEKLLNGQGYLEYDSTMLSLSSFTMANVSNAVINTELANTVKFNFTDCETLYDFTSSKTFIEVTFTVLASGTTTVNLNVEELNASSASGDVAYVTDGAVVGTFTMAATLSTPTSPSTKSTTPSLKTKSAKLNPGKTTTIKVKNQPSGTTLKFSSSNKKIATVSSKGKVTALKKGTAKITVKVKKGSTVVKKLTFTVTVKKNPSLKPAKTLKVKVGKTKTVKINGKASNVKNTYKVKNKKVAKVKTTNKNAKKIKVKGLKKGSTKLIVKVNGKKLTLKVKVTK